MISLKEVSIKSILMSDRFREDYGDVAMLAESLKQEGIIQPLAVRENEDETFTLLAGGRRLTAALLAGIETVPVRCYPPTLTDLEMKSIELMENVCRKDLTWLEAAKLKKEIHLLQVAIHGEKISTAPNAPGWGQRDTASLMDVSQFSIYQDIKLADAVAVFPELSKAKNKHEAAKMLDKFHEEMIRAELSARIESKTASTPIERVHQDLISRYIVGDFFEGIKNIPPSSIDFIELDPPYAIDLNQQKRDMAVAYTDNYNEVKQEDYVLFIANVLTECKRVMTDSSWLIIWHAKQWRADIARILDRLSLPFDEGIWYKGPVGQTNTPGLHLASSYEPFYYARKGNPSISRQGRSNVFHYKPVASTRKIHPTERPIEMIQDVMQTFCWEGAICLVPFLGSGNSILAASNLGMQAFGWDLSQAYKDGFTIRVSESKPTGYRSYKEDAKDA